MKTNVSIDYSDYHIVKVTDMHALCPHRKHIRKWADSNIDSEWGFSQILISYISTTRHYTSYFAVKDKCDVLALQLTHGDVVDIRCIWPTSLKFNIIPKRGLL